jgi:hypothetical protein
MIIFIMIEYLKHITAQEQRVKQRAKELGILLLEQMTWVDDKDMWLHDNNTTQPSKNFYFLK